MVLDFGTSAKGLAFGLQFFDLGLGLCLMAGRRPFR